jgi:hypothetical protein
VLRRRLERSASIVSAGYDDRTRVLEIEYAAGHVYEYVEVPLEVYEWFLKARSKGGFVNRMIKERYAYRVVPPEVSGEKTDLLEALRASLRPDEDAVPDGSEG